MRIMRSVMTYTRSEHSLATRSPSSQQTPIGKDASTMSLLIGRLGRRPMNLSMIQSHVPHIPKENGLLHTKGWKRFRNVAKSDKILTRAVMQSKIRQVRRSNKYMFGYLIPKAQKEALELDKESNNTKWADAPRDEMDCIKEQEVFTTCQRAKWDSNHK